MADDENKSGPPEKRQKLNDEEAVNDDEKPECSKQSNDENLGKNNNSCDDNSDSMSEISNLSGLSEEAWKPTSGAITWIQSQIVNGVNPRPILHSLIPDDTMIPDDMDDFMMWKIIITIMSEPEPRKKLSHVNTFHDVINLFRTCQNIMVLTGAGVSVSCGIPDFRSRDGIYARLAVDFPDLPDPQAMFDINYFRNDPRPFFKFAKEIYPGQFEPSRSHKFISTLEKQGKLLRNYTQNIDTLEQVAGISKVIQCHGSFATASCMSCKKKVDAEVVREDIFNQVIPRCTDCPADIATAIMKPDIVFFGESLSDEFHKQMTSDKDQCDLLIVIGSSLKVRPVALIPNSLPEHVPQILINREPLKHLNFDVELLGDCDTIIEELAKHLNWDGKCRSPVMSEISKDELKTPTPSESGENSNDNCSNEQRSGGESNLSSIKEQTSDNAIETSCSTTEPSPLTQSKTPSQASDNVVPQTSVLENMPKNSMQINDKEVTSLTTVVSSFSDNKPENLSGTKCGDQSSCSEGTSSQPLEDKVAESVPIKKPDLPQDKPSPTEEEGSNTGDKNDLEVMRNMWKPRYCSLAKRLGEKQYLFLPPNRYVFSGAEVYSDMEDDTSSDSSSDDSDSIDVGTDSQLSGVENEDSTSQLLNGEKTDSELEQKPISSEQFQKNGHNSNCLDPSKEQSCFAVISNSAKTDTSNNFSNKVMCGMHQPYEDLNEGAVEVAKNMQPKQNGIHQGSNDDENVI